MCRTRKSQIKEEKTSAHQSTNNLTCQGNSWKTKNRNKKTNCVHSTDPAHSINNTDDRIPNNKPLIPDAAFHPGPILRPPPKPIRQNDQSSQNTKDINMNINF